MSLENQSRPTVAILGAGAMGEALLSGLLTAGWTPDSIGVAARRPERAEAVEAGTGCRVSLDPVEAGAGRSVIVVATKPREAAGLLDPIAKYVAQPPSVVSLAAGAPRYSIA